MVDGLHRLDHFVSLIEQQALTRVRVDIDKRIVTGRDLQPNPMPFFEQLTRR